MICWFRICPPLTPINCPVMISRKVERVSLGCHELSPDSFLGVPLKVDPGTLSTNPTKAVKEG